MNKKQKMIFSPIENKTIGWFENTNEYIIFEPLAADILQKLHKGISIEEISIKLSKELEVPTEEAANFAKSLLKKIEKPKSNKETEPIADYKSIRKEITFETHKFYKINNLIIKVSFLSEYELYLTHPKFEHLEIVTPQKEHHHFEIFSDNLNTFLLVDNHFIGAWNRENIHYFQGKFSMELIQKIHQKEEKEWLGVFHASAVSNGKKSILFLGDSGNGKSTSLALLQANGFNCLADDFVPVDAKTQQVFSFPASISIKKNSLTTLLPIYPELENSAEFHFKRLNKVVRYLRPNNNDFLGHLPCHDLVFIKYEKDAKLTCKKISKIDAFQQLIPDSWLSPIEKNVQTFLDWFANLNCYQLKYSNNKKMIEKVGKIFSNEL